MQAQILAIRKVDKLLKQIMMHDGFSEIMLISDRDWLGVEYRQIQSLSTIQVDGLRTLRSKINLVVRFSYEA